MKIGILTHSLGSNYGGILQNFALHAILKQLGHSPITINHYSETKWYIKVLSVFKRSYRRYVLNEDVALRGWMTISEYKVITQNTSKFISNYITLTPRCKLTSIKKLKNYGFEALIVGSDQVWRGKGRDVEHFFFSDFYGIDIPKIAYAASFGVDEWNLDYKQTRHCKKLIKQFNAISVRESSAIYLCRKNLDVDAELVLDPTLLLNSDDYIRLVAKDSFSKKRESLVVYILDQDSFKSNIVYEIVAFSNLKPNYLMPATRFGVNKQNNLYSLVLDSVENWLKAFHTADFVITDSFHGTVFSIIFNKPFAVLVNKQRGASRFYSLLDMLNLNDRIIHGKDDIQRVMTDTINWTDVNQKLELYREKSINFLMKALNDE